MDLEPQVRLGVSLSVFLIMALWEVLSPRRVLGSSKLLRWSSNIGLALLNTFLLRIIFPAAAVGMAIVAEERGFGLVNNFDIPYWVAVIGCVVFLDFAIYVQHVLFHSIPGFWRFHRMHHTDLDYDVTTGARFHPVEIIASMIIKLGVVSIIGAPPLAVLIFETLLNATAMFNHSNVYIPLSIDKTIRALVVTPDMHRVHHSVTSHETNSNFGFNLAIWDRALGTYLDQPEKGHDNMTIGIDQFRESKFLRFHNMLLIPFLGDVTGYAINRRRFK